MSGQCSVMTESLGSLETKKHCQKIKKITIVVTIIKTIIAPVLQPLSNKNWDECQRNHQVSHCNCPAALVSSHCKNKSNWISWKVRYWLHLSSSRSDCILCRLVGSKSLSVTLVCNFCQNKVVMIFGKVTKYLRSRGSRGKKQERGKGNGESEHFER